MSDPASTGNIGMQILIEAAKVAAGFGVGVLVKRTFWRKIIYIKKWFANDILTLSLLAVRQYPHVNVKDMELAVFDHIKNKIQNVTLIQRQPNGMMINIAPIFGNLIIEVEKSNPIIEDGDDETMIKLSVRTENTIRLGMREIKKLNDFEKYAETIFDTIQALLFSEQKPAKQSFAVCDISRTVYFVEQKKFDLRDNALNARIIGTDDKLTITTSPIGNIAEATEKYRFS